MHFKILILTGITFLLITEVLSQEQPCLQDGSYKMKYQKGSIYELEIENDRYTLSSKTQKELTGKVVWINECYFTLIGDQSQIDIDTLSAKEKLLYSMRNSSYQLNKLNSTTYQFRQTPEGNLHITRGTGKLKKIKD